MTFKHQRPSATIYPFPSRRPTGSGLKREAREAWVKATQPLVAAVVGDSWYHEAALREEDPARSH